MLGCFSGGGHSLRCQGKEQHSQMALDLVAAMDSSLSNRLTHSKAGQLDFVDLTQSS